MCSASRAIAVFFAEPAAGEDSVMAAEIVDELQTLYVRFDQAERVWLNRLDDLDKAYKKGWEEFDKHRPKKKAPPISAEDAVDLGGQAFVASLALGAGPAAAAVPILYGVKKLASAVGQGVQAPDPDVLTLKNRLNDIRDSFKGTTEHLGGEIVKLLDKAKATKTNGSPADIQGTIGKLLLSPIWHPPKKANIEKMARPLEMRIWFRYWMQLANMGHDALDLDLNPMFEHLKNINYQPISLEGKPSDQSYTAAGWKLDAVLYLALYGQKHTRLNIPHEFPAPVQEYLKRATNYNDPKWWATATKSVDDNLLPPSTLTWANLSLEK